MNGSQHSTLAAFKTEREADGSHVGVSYAVRSQLPDTHVESGVDDIVDGMWASDFEAANQTSLGTGDSGDLDDFLDAIMNASDDDDDGIGGADLAVVLSGTRAYSTAQLQDAIAVPVDSPSRFSCEEDVAGFLDVDVDSSLDVVGRRGSRALLQPSVGLSTRAGGDVDDFMAFHDGGRMMTSRGNDGLMTSRRGGGMMTSRDPSAVTTSRGNDGMITSRRSDGMGGAPLSAVVSEAGSVRLGGAVRVPIDGVSLVEPASQRSRRLLVSDSADGSALDRTERQFSTMEGTEWLPGATARTIGVNDGAHTTRTAVTPMGASVYATSSLAPSSPRLASTLASAMGDGDATTRTLMGSMTARR